MSTAAAPVEETGGSAVSVDPIDALDLSSVGDDVEMTSDTELPESMIVGGKPKVDEEAPAERNDGRTPDGKFAKKEEEAPAADATPVAPSPFQYRAMGQTHALEGAQVDPATGNLTIPAAKVADVQEAFNALHLAKGEYIPVIQRHQQNNAALRQQLEEAKAASSAENEQAKALVDFFASIAAEPDDNAALKMMWDLRANFPQLKAAAENAYLKKQLEARSKPAAAPQSTEPTPHQAHSIPSSEVVQATATDYLETLRVHPEYRDLSPDAWSKVAKSIDSRPFSYARPATAQDAKDYGVTEGQIVFDAALVRADVELQRDALKAQREAAESQVRLAAENSRRTQPSIAAPPSPGGGRAPIQKPKSPQTKDELEDWFNSSEI